MLDTIKTVVEIIDKVLPRLVAFGGYMKQAKLRKIGSTLFQIYISLNEIIIAGRIIIVGIKEFLQKSRNYVEGKVPYSYTMHMGIRLRDYVAIQKINMQKVAACVAEMAPELQVVDAESYNWSFANFAETA